MKRGLLLLLLVGLLAGGGYWFWHNFTTGAVTYRTAPVERGDLVVSINASGVVQPEEVVDVGAQVAGMIVSLGEDPRGNGRTIDYGTPVEEGTILARIDDAIYRSQVASAQAVVEQAQGQLASAKALVAQAEANVKRAEADLLQTQAKQHQADRDLERARNLTRTGPGAISQADYDLAEANQRTAAANVAVAQATIAQQKAAQEDAKANVLKAQGSVSDTQASLQRAQINLSYCTIKSPVKGVIIDRRINVGQTVVSSLNAPSLFLLAKDLRRLQVLAQVNEADIANIKSGQSVSFTVDALPGRAFPGIVAPDQPRLNVTNTQNVVTYPVVVSCDNSSGLLKPYLTASLDFEVSRRQNVLLIPNGALRYKPQNAEIGVAGDGASGEETRARKAERPPGEKPTTPREQHDRGVVWVQNNGQPHAVPVRTGLSDGIKTEIVGGELRDGERVIVGEMRQDPGAPAGGGSPFTPQINRKKPQ